MGETQTEAGWQGMVGWMETLPNLVSSFLWTFSGPTSSSFLCLSFYLETQCLHQTGGQVGDAYLIKYKKSCWCLTETFTATGTGRYSACYQRRKVNTKAITNTSIYNSDLPAGHSTTTVAQILWVQPTSLWSNLRPIPWGGTHAWHCFGGQEPEFRPGIWGVVIVLLIECRYKLVLLTLCYTHRSVSPSGKLPPESMWELTQWLTLVNVKKISDLGTLSYKWGVSMKFPL